MRVVRLAEVEFGVAYDGPRLDMGKMDVRDLAPALLALGDLFVEAGHVLQPDREPLALTVKATDTGSFLVHLALESRSAWDQVVNIFASDGATALFNIKELVIGGSSVSLFALIKRLRGRKVTAQEPTSAGTVRITLDDQTTVEVPADVMALYGNVEIRQKARQVVEPLNRAGIEAVKFTEDKRTTVTIEKGDVPAFDLPDEPEDVLTEYTVSMVLEIAAPAFVDGNKWRLSDGDGTFYAAMDDQAFLDRVNRGVEVFRKGDRLRCDVRVIQTTGPDGLHTERRVLRVVEHIPRSVQLRFDEPADSGG